MSAVCFSLCRPTQIKVNEKPADKLISGRWFWSFTALINCPWRPLAQQQNYKMKMIWAAIRWLPILSLLPIESPKMSMYRKFYTVFLELFSIMRTHFPLLDHFFWFLSHSVCLSGAVIAVWNLLADNFCQFWQINVCRLWFIWWSECCYGCRTASAYLSIYCFESYGHWWLWYIYFMGTNHMRPRLRTNCRMESNESHIFAGRGRKTSHQSAIWSNFWSHGRLSDKWNRIKAYCPRVGHFTAAFPPYHSLIFLWLPIIHLMKLSRALTRNERCAPVCECVVGSNDFGIVSWTRHSHLNEAYYHQIVLKCANARVFCVWVREFLVCTWLVWHGQLQGF